MAGWQPVQRLHGDALRSELGTSLLPLPLLGVSSVRSVWPRGAPMDQERSELVWVGGLH